MPRTTRYTPTKGAAEVMDVLAHIMISEGMERAAGELGKGFSKHYKKSLTLRQKAIERHFYDRVAEIKEELARLIEKEGWNKEGGDGQ